MRTWRVAVIALVAIGCASVAMLYWRARASDGVRDTTTSTVVEAQDFRFWVGDGSVLKNYEVLEIRGDGRCTSWFPVYSPATRSSHPQAIDVQWYQSQFVLGKADVIRLREMLIKLRFCSLSDRNDTSVSDGSHTFVGVEGAGHRKVVHWVNAPDRSMKQIQAFAKSVLAQSPNTPQEHSVAISSDAARRAISEMQN